MSRFPNLLIVGAQKSGTTHAHQVLSGSPEIFGSAVKELNFFNHTDCYEGQAQARYRDNFPAGAQRYYLESTPSYFRLPFPRGKWRTVTPDVAAAIADILPAADRRLIVILRNPVERAISATKHYLAMGDLPPTEVIDAVHRRHGIVNRGLYGAILQSWRSVFGADLGVFFYDDLEASPQSFFAGICGFLGVDTGFLDTAPVTRRVNASDAMARSRGRSRVRGVAPEVISQLVAIYREDVDRLFRMEGVDFPAWLDEEALVEKYRP